MTQPSLSGTAYWGQQAWRALVLGLVFGVAGFLRTRSLLAILLAVAMATVFMMVYGVFETVTNRRPAKADRLFPLAKFATAVRAMPRWQVPLLMGAYIASIGLSATRALSGGTAERWFVLAAALASLAAVIVIRARH